MSAKVQLFTVSADEDGQRLDNYLVTRLKGVPKSAVYRVIRKGEVRVNKGRAKPERRLQTGDVIRVPPLRLAETQPLAAPGQSLVLHLQDAVLYDECGLLIVNKPAGLAVHGGSGISLGLIEALRQMPGHHGFLELIHRLDRETSGCVMIARKRSVLKYFQEGLRERQGVQKSYLALVQGRWPKGVTQVDVPLKRFLQNDGERIVRVNAEGKPSLTRFEVLEVLPQATLVRASPVTGRTHQIRVHALHKGCPLVGDDKYGDTALNESLRGQGSRRLFLHAEKLDLTLPDGKSLSVAAPLPDDLDNLLLKLRQTSAHP
ncbi:MAG: 23S rRNA pseudouridine(955/2504/2580) synthase RluC [Cellvibrionaceae bacterium]|nr:23S rRNA pseudouridine(955/2504/2580) synthase RluC [Cellvibrionaceae bacterium]